MTTLTYKAEIFRANGFLHRPTTYEFLVTYMKPENWTTHMCTELNITYSRTYGSLVFGFAKSYVSREIKFANL